MSDTPHRRMKYVMESLEVDQEFRWLRSRRDGMEEHVAAICGELSHEDRALLLDYWGISREMMLRMVEIACLIDEL